MATSRPARGNSEFRSTGQPIVPRMLAAQIAKTPAERRSVEELMLTCLKHYEDSARKNGGTVQDVARAMGYAVVANYSVYSGEDISREQTLQLRAKLKQILSTSSDFQAKSDRERQQFYELSAIMGAFIELGSLAAQLTENDELEENLQQLAAQNLESLLGSPASKIRFTSSGLTIDQ